MDPHAKWCILIGYPSLQKGYRVMEISIGQFFVSIVVFHEDIFPFQEITSSSQSSASAFNHHYFLSEEDLFVGSQYIMIAPEPQVPIMTESLNQGVELLVSSYEDIHSLNPSTSSPSWIHHESSSPTPEQTRTIQPRPPTRTKDYVCPTMNSLGTQYPVSLYVSFSRLSPEHV